MRDLLFAHDEIIGAQLQGFLAHLVVVRVRGDDDGVLDAISRLERQGERKDKNDRYQRGGESVPAAHTYYLTSAARLPLHKLTNAVLFNSNRIARRQTRVLEGTESNLGFGKVEIVAALFRGAAAVTIGAAHFALGNLFRD